MESVCSDRQAASLAPIIATMNPTETLRVLDDESISADKSTKAQSASADGVSNEAGTHTCVRHWRPSDAASIITILVLLATGIRFWLPTKGSAGLYSFTMEHVALLKMVDTSVQRSAQRVALFSLALLCIFGAAVITRRLAHLRQVDGAVRAIGDFFRSWCGVFIAVAAAMVIIFNLPGTVFPGPSGRALFIVLWAASICLVTPLLYRGAQRKSRAFTAVIWGCIAVYVLLLTVPGLLRVPYMSESLPDKVEWHYSATLSQGDRLAVGLPLGTQVNLNYGLLPSLAGGAFERARGLLDFAGHFRLIQISQIAFLLVAILGFYLWRPNNKLYLVFSTLSIGAWLSTSHISVYYPNQSGWRSLGLAAGVVILLLSRKAPRGMELILGAAACLLILYNPETGLCISFGYALFLLSRLKRLSLASICGIALRSVAGAGLVLLAVITLYRAGLGVWPPLSFAPLLGFITKFGQGYGGLPLYFDPLALLIFVHCIYIVSSLVLKWRLRPLQFEEGVRLAIAATVLTWSTYFINRPYSWNLWTYQFLYLFLITDIFEIRLLRLPYRRGLVSTLLDARLAAMTFVLIPMLLATNYFIFFTAEIPSANSEMPTAMVSGMKMPQSMANSVRAQADFLKIQDASTTVFFTRHSYLLSVLAKRFNPLPVQDAFAETVTNSDFDALAAETERLSPRIILFDDRPEKSVILEDFDVLFYVHFFERLKARLADRYCQGPSIAGWQVFHLRPPSGSSDFGQGICHP